MSDDIETLRKIVVANMAPNIQREEALAALERVEKELAFVSREGNRLANDLRNTKAERDALRAKLEKAKPIVAAYAQANPKHKPWQRPEQDPMGAHALLVELSADDAPAQPPQISDESANSVGLETAVAIAICRVQLNGNDPSQPAIRWNGVEMEPQDFPIWMDFRDEARAAIAAALEVMKGQR